MLYERWRQIARERRRETALWELSSGRRWTFSELDRQVDRAARPTQPLLFPQGNSAEFIFRLLAGWRAQTVVCPLEPDQAPPLVPLPPPACVHLKLTSATTGSPRVIAFTAEQLTADAAQIVETMGLRPEWPNLGAISLAHSYGFSNLVLPLLLHGIPLILTASPLPEMVRRAGAGHAHLTLAGVPALWRAWHQAKAIPYQVRLAISAGAPLPGPLEQEVYRAFGLKIHNFYGASECGGIAYDATQTPRADEACVGHALRGVRLRIGPEGCLEVRSAAVGQTYWPEPDPALGQGRFRTTDLAELAHGLVFLRGRVSDQINVAGRKVSPATIERALRQHPAVRDCLVFGVPGDPGRGDQIIACVAAHGPHPAAELKKFLLHKLPSWQVPRHWRFVESLETDHRGKLSRLEWRRRFLNNKMEPRGSTRSG